MSIENNTVPPKKTIPMIENNADLPTLFCSGVGDQLSETGPDVVKPVQGWQLVVETEAGRQLHLLHTVALVLRILEATFNR